MKGMDEFNRLIEEVKQGICDDYCRFTHEEDVDEEYIINHVCPDCPLMRL